MYERCLFLCQVVVPILQMWIMRLRQVRYWALPQKTASKWHVFWLQTLTFCDSNLPACVCSCICYPPKGSACSSKCWVNAGLPEESRGECALSCGVGRSWELCGCQPPLPRFPGVWRLLGRWKLCSCRAFYSSFLPSSTPLGRCTLLQFSLRVLWTYHVLRSGHTKITHTQARTHTRTRSPCLWGAHSLDNKEIIVSSNVWMLPFLVVGLPTPSSTKVHSGRGGGERGSGSGHGRMEALPPGSFGL